MTDSENSQRVPTSDSTTWVPGASDGDLLSADPSAERQGVTKERLDVASIIEVASGKNRAEKFLERIGDFRIVKRLGQGGMGVVYEAQQISLQRTVALKILPLAGRMDERQIKRFQNESRAAAQLSHPNIVPVYSVGTDEGMHYYAMQLIRGNDLAHHIRYAKSMVDSKAARRSGETPKAVGGTTVENAGHKNGNVKSNSNSLAESASCGSFLSAEFVEMMTDRSSGIVSRRVLGSVVQIGIDAAEALHHAHLLGIVHRDIKPSNLLLDEQNKVWITDFGLAQVQGAAALTMTGEVVGTLRYMSPEQPLGQRVLVDQRTDIYSLGVTLYELLTLTKAFGAEAPKEIIRQVCFEEPRGIRRLNPHVPEDLETIVLKAMSKNPDERYQTAKELADDLQRFSRDEPILARRPNKIQQCRRWVRQHTAAATAIAVVIAVLFIASLTASAVSLNAWAAEIKQRKRAESLLEKSEGLRLVANSFLEADNNPGLSLLLAIKGAELNPSVDASSALLNALNKNHEERTFLPRREFTNGITISPDGRRVVSTIERAYFGQGEFPAIESDVQTGETLRTFEDGTAITSCTYSPDGRFLLTTAAPFRKSGKPAIEATGAAIDGVPVIWDATTGNKILALNDAVADEIRGGEFSPSSESFVVPGRGNNANIYTAKDGRLKSSLRGHSSEVFYASFSPDGNRVVSVGGDNTIRVWDVSSTLELRQFSVKADRSKTPPVVGFLGDADRLIISSEEGTRIVSVRNGEQLNRKHWDESASAASRDGRYVALYLRFGKQVTVWDTQTYGVVTQLDSDDYISSVEFSVDGRKILVTTMSLASVHRTVDGALLAQLKGHTEQLTAGRLSPSGERVVTAAQDGTVRSWYLRNGAERQTISVRPAKVAPSPWGFSADSALAAVAIEPAFHVGLRDVSGNPVSQDFAGRIIRNAANSSGLVTYDDHEVSVWHVPSSRRIASFSHESGTVRDAVLVPGTSIVVVLVDHDSAILWNTESDVRIKVGGADAKVQQVDVHPSNGTIAVALWDGECLILDAVTGKVHRTLQHEAGVLSVSFSESGSRILTVDTSDTARIWLPDEHSPAQVLTDLNGSLDRARFSPDESVVVTWSAFHNECVRAWRTETGQLISKTKEKTVQNIAVHDSQPIVAIGSSSEGLLLWDWMTGEEKQLTKESSKAPLFLGDQLMYVESAPGFQLTKSVIPGYSGQPEFARSHLVVRDVNTTNVVASQPLAVEPWNLSLDRDTGNALLSFKTHDAALIRLQDHQSQTVVGRHAAPLVFQGISDSCKQVVCASMDGTASIWDYSGRLTHLLKEHKHPIVSAALSPDGRRLATFDTIGVGQVWNLADGAQTMELPGRSSIISSVRFSASGKQLMTSGSDSKVDVWDLNTKTKTTLQFEPGVLSVEWSPDERLLLVITGNAQQQSPLAPSEAFLIRPDGQSKVNLSPAGVPRLGRFHPGGKHVVILSSDGIATLCSTTGQPVSKFDPNRRPIEDVAFSPDGVDLLVLHEDELSLWDVDACEEIVRIPMFMSSRSGELKFRTETAWKPFSPDGNWILTDRIQLRKWPRDPLVEALRQAPRPIGEQEVQRFSIPSIGQLPTK